MKKLQTIFLLSLSFISNQLYAQGKDSGTIQEATKQIKAEFPRTRIFNFEYGHSLSRDFNSELIDEDYDAETDTDDDTDDDAINDHKIERECVELLTKARGES